MTKTPVPPNLDDLSAAELQATIRDLQDKVAELTAYNERLQALIAELEQALYGKKSEKLTEEERELAYEDLEAAIAEVEEERPDTANKPKRPAKRNLGNLPKDLPRIEQIIEPESTQCPCGCGEMVRIGEDRTERLDVIPAQFRVIVTIRPKYACRQCTDGVTQAKAPAYLVEGGLPTEALIAHVLVSKYADHSPLYRQAQIYARSGIDLDRSTLAGWVGKAGFHLGAIVARMVEHVKASKHLSMDETRAPVLEPGRGKTKTGYLWALSRDQRGWGGKDPPAVIYFYADGRGGKHAEAFLEGFTGTLQVDGYAGYNRLTKPTRGEGPVTLAFCWSHARRKLKEIHSRDASAIAAEGLQQIAAFYAIEAEIRGQSPDRRLAAREEKTKPLMDDFKKWLNRQSARVSAKSRLGEKLAYIKNHWTGLQVFLTDGHVDMDTNAVENKIRPLVLNRKNALFAGHDEGGKNWGRIASLIETAKLNGVNPFDYLNDTLQAIAQSHPQSEIDQLLPWNYKSTSK